MHYNKEQTYITMFLLHIGSKLEFYINNDTKKPIPIPIESLPTKYDLFINKQILKLEKIETNPCHATFISQPRQSSSVAQQ